MPEAAAVAKIVRQAAMHMRLGPGRQGNVQPVDADEILVGGDLHGHTPNFKRLVQLADLADNPCKQEGTHDERHHGNSDNRHHQQQADRSREEQHQEPADDQQRSRAQPTRSSSRPPARLGKAPGAGNDGGGRQRAILGSSSG